MTNQDRSSTVRQCDFNEQITEMVAEYRAYRRAMRRRYGLHLPRRLRKRWMS